MRVDMTGGVGDAPGGPPLDFITEFRCRHNQALPHLSKTVHFSSLPEKHQALQLPPPIPQAVEVTLY